MNLESKQSVKWKDTSQPESQGLTMRSPVVVLCTHSFDFLVQQKNSELSVKVPAPRKVGAKQLGIEGCHPFENGKNPEST